MGKDFIATLTDPERAKAFVEIFGSASVYIESPIGQLADLPGKPEARIFKLDLSLITPEQKQKLAEHIAQRWELPLEEVAADIDKQGVPILDEQCYVTVLNPQKWFD